MRFLSLVALSGYLHHERARCVLFLRERAGVAVVAGEVFIHCIDVEKAVAFRVQFLELFAAALSQNRVAGVAIAGLDLRLAVGGFVQAVMTAETARRILVTDVVWVGSPVRLHLGKDAPLENFLGRVDRGFDLRRVRVLRPERRGDFL